MNSSKHANLWQLFKSVAASAFGVQSQQNYQRDFEQKSVVPFVVMGVIFVVAFVLTLVVVVNLVIPG